MSASIVSPEANSPGWLGTSAQYIPQGAYTNNLPWPAAIPDPNQMPNNLTKPDGGTDENPYTTGPGPDPICAGPTHTVQVKTITGTGTVGAATLTDSTKSWGENQLIGRTVGYEYAVY